VHICLINNLFPPVPSGSSHFTWDLSRHLVKRGHHVVVITAHAIEDTPAEEVKDGVHIYRLPCIRLPQLKIAHNFKWFTYTFTPSNVSAVRKIIKEHGIEILHLNGHIFDLALSAIRARRRESLPLVLTVHLEITHSKPIYRSILHLADRIFVRNVLIRRCSTVVSPERNMYEYVRRVYHRESEIVPYGVEYPLSFEANGAEELIKRYSIGQRPSIISLGHVHTLRDRVDLIRSMPEVLKQIPNTILLIIGQVYTNEPVKLVRELGLQDNVVFTGPLSRDTALALMQAGDVEAHWLNVGNGLGIASLEAMALGKTVVTVCREDLLGPPIVKSWENFVPAPIEQPDEIAETLVKVLSDKSLQKQIGKAGQMLICDYFTWDKVCERMEVVYQNAIEKRKD
jgi:glycosyltransferase involved in cell wall biosynthesis